MALELIRIDDRLLHGQVVVGWGQRLELKWYVVADDDLAGTAWEQRLYRDALPPGCEVEFLDVDEVVDRFDELSERRGPGALITRGTRAMRRLAEAGCLEGRRVNLGCVGAQEDRRRALPYLHLSDREADDLETLRALGADVEARDVPSARPVPVEELLRKLEDA